MLKFAIPNILKILLIKKYILIVPIISIKIIPTEYVIILISIPKHLYFNSESFT